MDKTSRLVLRIIGLIFLAALPFVLWEAWHKGEIYLFSKSFIDELPRRLTGPGRMRFLLQPVMAIALGIGSGVAAAREGSGGLAAVLDPQQRATVMKASYERLSALLCVAVLLDCLAQFLIYGLVHPGAALVVGPILIVVPFALSRMLARWLWLLFNPATS